MKKNNVSVVYDRKKKVEKSGIGTVEIYIYLGREERKYVTYTSCNPLEWRKISLSKELQEEIALYEQIVQNMMKGGEDMTIYNLNAHLGIAPEDERTNPRKRKLQTSPTGFVDFVMEESAKEQMKPSTRQRIRLVMDAVLRYGKLSRLSDLIDKNVKGFDEFLREEMPSRTEQTLNNYHKNLKKYCRLAYQLDYIAKNPYDSMLCKFKRGEARTRRPLLEDELILVREAKGLSIPENHARDLFIFSAYTGLAYIDNQNFDFNTMTEKIGDTYYIDGNRLKNGHNFFTPILPPAMAVLKKYRYRLPRMSNQKMNMYLHLVETRLGLHKPLTSHVARHSFATLTLAHDIPIENVARMLGHTNTNTTRIYAKVLKTTIERHTINLVASLK